MSVADKPSFYNDDRKQAFVKGHYKSLTTQKVVLNHLRRFASTEEKYNTDLCRLSKNDIKKVLCKGKLNIQSISMVLLSISNYTKWCEEHGYAINKELLDIEIDLSGSINRSMVDSPEMLSERLDIIFGDRENETINVIYKAFLWMAFMGLQDVEAMDVKLKDVDLEEMVVNFKNEQFKIYEEAKEVFQNAHSLKKFKVFNKIYWTETTVERSNSEYLLSGSQSKRFDISVLRSSISRIMGETIFRMSYQKIYNSGLFYKRSSLDKGVAEESTVLLNSDELFYIEADKKMARNERSSKMNKIQKHRNLYQIVYRLNQNYEAWKQAFAV